jgi:hypothetical protein
MHLIYTITVCCLLLGINNARNLKEIQNKIRSRLQNQSSQLRIPTPIPRQSHLCYIDCFAILRFNDSTAIPPVHCNETQTIFPCVMIAMFHYAAKTIGFYTYTATESLTHGNMTYDAAIVHLVHFDYLDSTIFHLLEYSCTQGDYCEWNYIKEMIPKLIALDYQSLHDSLILKVVNSNSHPALTECYNNTELVDCSLGSCEFSQSTDDNYKLIKTRNCAPFFESFVTAGKVQYLSGPTQRDYDAMSFTCDKDRCNDEANENEIRQLIQAQGNEYINTISSGNKFSLVDFSLYFLCFALIK